MGATVGEILTFAVGVAISPVPVIAVILMLFGNSARVNGVSFALGWIIGLAVAGAVVLAIGLEASDGGEADSGGWVRVVIGLLFIALAVKQWSGRPRQGEEAEMPKWMASIDGFSAVKSFAMAVLLAAVNPKNLGLTIAAAATIGASGLESGEEYIVLGVFVLLASLTVAVPVVWYLIQGESAEVRLGLLKEWLVANNNTVMAVLLVVLGAKILGDGIAVLA
ncbi:MAG: GAP family protein [Acidimicrobiales bacterium]